MASLSAGPQIERLIQLLAKLPGLGPRSARRAALALLKKRDVLLEPLSAAMRDAAAAIKTCETCGNEYDKVFQVLKAGQTHSFDSFECAIQMLAQTCATCGCRIIGHGLEQDDRIYCCAHCAGRDGGSGLRDRA